MVSGGADHSFWWFQGALIIRAALAYTAFSFDLCTQPPWRWITPDSVLHMMQTWQPHLSPYSERLHTLNLTMKLLALSAYAYTPLAPFVVLLDMFRFRKKHVITTHAAPAASGIPAQAYGQR